MCPSTYYADAALSTCRRCIVGCQNCTDNVSCLVCLSGFIRLNNQCLSECPFGYLDVSGRCFSCISPCASCSNSLSSCTTCISGYNLLAGNQCVQTCPLGYFLPANSSTCTACSPQCATCTTSTSCASCVNSQYLAP